MCKAFFFNGSNYVRYDIKNKSADSGYPLPILPTWSGLPQDGVDAALNWGNGYVLFFVGNQYFAYSTKTDRVEGGASPIASRFPGLTLDRVDACFINPDKKKAYFFRRDQYWRFHIPSNAVEAGFPKPIAGLWPGLFSSDLDGALNVGNGKAYFFKGAEYTQYDLPSDKADAGFPKPISGDWPGLFNPGVKAPVILGYAGFDRLTYPSDAVMNDLWNNTNLRWCGFYLAPSPSQSYEGWMKKRGLLVAKGWGLAPIYVGEQQAELTPTPGSHNPSGLKGNTDGLEATKRAADAGFPKGSILYLDIETGGPIQDVLKDYYLAWVQKVIDETYTPGLYCSYRLAEQFKSFDSRPVFWSWNLNRYPTGPTTNFPLPFPSPEPVFANEEFLSNWQLSQNTNLVLSPTNTLKQYDLNSSCFRDPSTLP